MYYDGCDDGSRLNPALAPGEYIIIRLKPNKVAYIADKSLRMLPIAALWMIVDFRYIQALLSAPKIDWGMLLFMCVHLLPFWTWLAEILTAIHQWKNEEYFLTNHRILIFHGMFSQKRDCVYLSGLWSSQVKIDWVDRIFGTGDVLLNYERQGKMTTGFQLMNLSKPYEVIHRIEQQSIEMKKREAQARFEGGGEYAHSDTQ